MVKVHPVNGRPSGLRRLASTLALGVASGTMALALTTPAQAQESQSSLRGTVSADGGVTQVTAIEVNTGITRTATVSPDGGYNFASLRPGVYRLELTTPNGVRQTDQFTLSVAQDAVLDFDFTTAEVAEGNSEGIIITGSRIRTLEGGEVGVNISQREIEQLPQNNRNFLAFADLAPGVQFANPNGQSRIQGGAQDSRTVNVFIDGVGQKDYVLKNGVTGQDSTQGNPFPQLAVGEYRVISSNYKAEFDQVSSVAITAVTKSGTNQFHGEGFIDYTDQSLREKTPQEKFISGTKTKSKDFQFGGALGGPIIPDVMHFFATYEGKRQENPREITPGLSFPVSVFPTALQGEFGQTKATFNEDLYFAKIDVSPTDNDLVELSGKYRDESGEFLGNGINARSTISSQDVKEKRGLLRWEHTANSFVNDLKLTYEDARYAPTPAVFGNGSIFSFAQTQPGTPPTVLRGDLLRIGGGANYQDKGQKGYSVQDDFTYTALENHMIKAGAKVKFVKLRTLQLNNFNPVYTYNVAFNPNGGTFNDQIPYRAQFGFSTGNGSPVVKSDNFQLGLYVQDDWDVTDRLTLNLGIRWDYDRTPSYINFVTPADAVAAVSPANYPNLTNADYDINDFITDGSRRKTFTGAFQPRVGFSYAIDQDRRFTVFGGYGRSYDRNQFDFLQQEISVGSFTTRTFNFNTGDPLNTCDPSPTCVPFDPVYLTDAGRAQLVANAGAGGGRELRFINNDLKIPYSDQFSLGLRSQVTDLFNAEVGYTHIQSRDGFAYLLGNRRPDGTFFPPAPAGPDSPFGFAPPGFGSIIIGTNGLKTNADTGYLKLVKNYRPSSPWNLTATYTYTQAEENRNFGEVFSLDFPSLDDYPVVRSGGVRKHRLVMAGSVDTPIGVTLSSKVVVSSPPYLKSFINTGGPNPVRDVVAAQGFSNGDRWGFRQIDFAATKYLPLRFLTEDSRIRVRVDIINLFNDRNYTNYNDNPNDNIRTSPQDTVYREIVRYGTGSNPPRTIKLSTGFSF